MTHQFKEGSHKSKRFTERICPILKPKELLNSHLQMKKQ